MATDLETASENNKGHAKLAPERNLSLGGRENWSCSICESSKRPISGSLISAIKSTSGPVPRWWGSKEGALTIRQQLAQALESRTAHIVIVCLTLLDLSVVMTELVLASFYPEHRPDAVEEAEKFFSFTSIAILSLFTLEQMVRLIVFGFRYFAHLWHALDAFIIVASLVLEAVLRGAAQETVSLLVIFRLWRLVRILHGTAETMMLDHESKLEKHHEVEKELEEKLLKGKQKILYLQRQLEGLGGTPQD